jgi:hypothetical protein
MPVCRPARLLFLYLLGLLTSMSTLSQPIALTPSTAGFSSEFPHDEAHHKWTWGSLWETLVQLYRRSASLLIIMVPYHMTYPDTVILASSSSSSRRYLTPAERSAFLLLTNIHLVKRNMYERGRQTTQQHRSTSANV